MMYGYTKDTLKGIEQGLYDDMYTLDEFRRCIIK